MADPEQHTHQVEQAKEVEQVKGAEPEQPLPPVVELDDLDAITDPDQKRWRKLLSMNENIAPFPAPVFLMEDTDRTLYAVGWSRYDILVIMVYKDDRPPRGSHTLSSYTTHAPWYFNKINPEMLQELWRNRPIIVLRPPANQDNPKPSTDV